MSKKNKVMVVALAFMVAVTPLVATMAEETNTYPNYTKRYVSKACKAYQDDSNKDKYAANLEKLITRLETKMEAYENKKAKTQTVIDDLTAQRAEFVAFTEELKGDTPPSYCTANFEQQATEETNIYTEYTKRYVSKACNAYQNDSNRNKYAANLEKLITRLESKMEAYENKKAKTQTVIDTLTDQRNEFLTFTEELKGDTTPSYCLSIFEEQNEKIILKQEKIKANLEKTQKKYEDKLASITEQYNKKIETLQERVDEAQSQIDSLMSQNEAYQDKQNGESSEAAQTTQVAAQSQSSNGDSEQTQSQDGNTVTEQNRNQDSASEQTQSQSGDSVSEPAQNNASENKPDETPVNDNLDFDGDGLVDTMENQLGTNPTNPDTDGDGYSDGEEVRSGYNPLGGERMDEMQS